MSMGSGYPPKCVNVTGIVRGVDPETGMRDGSVRTYGTWTGVHTESGKEWALKSYHPMAFKDGKIIGGGDYFDFGGFMASFE